VRRQSAAERPKTTLRENHRGRADRSSDAILSWLVVGLDGFCHYFLASGRDAEDSGSKVLYQ
jgi:hypothetical protein